MRRCGVLCNCLYGFWKTESLRSQRRARSPGNAVSRINQQGIPSSFELHDGPEILALANSLQRRTSLFLCGLWFRAPVLRRNVRGTRLQDLDGTHWCLGITGILCIKRAKNRRWRITGHVGTSMAVLLGKGVQYADNKDLTGGTGNS